MQWSLPKRSVLVPYDFSEPAAAALAAARSMVANPADIDVLYVVAPPSNSSPGVIWGDINEGTMLSKAQAALAEAVQEILPGAQPRVEIGDPGDAIVGYAADAGSELIVIPSHGRRGFQRWLLGSVAERVVRLAPCPVLVLRRPLHDPED